MSNIDTLLKIQDKTEQLISAYEQRISTLEEQNQIISADLESALKLLEAYDKMRAIRLRKLFFYSEQ